MKIISWKAQIVLWNSTMLWQNSERISLFTICELTNFNVSCFKSLPTLYYFFPTLHFHFFTLRLPQKFKTSHVSDWKEAQTFLIKLFSAAIFQFPYSCILQIFFPVKQKSVIHMKGYKQTKHKKFLSACMHKRHSGHYKFHLMLTFLCFSLFSLSRAFVRILCVCCPRKIRRKYQPTMRSKASQVCIVH
jgi:hypothetical protein